MVDLVGKLFDELGIIHIEVSLRQLHNKREGRRLQINFIPIILDYPTFWFERKDGEGRCENDAQEGWRRR